MIVRRTTALSVLMVAALAGTLLTASPAQAKPSVTKAPVAVGRGGAASTVDIDATRVAIDVLRHGGNAVDAAVASAATLGVTEPFSSGLGGGGFFVFYNARTGKVHTIDGREAAPASMEKDAFVNPATGLPYAFQEARISGISVGVPGTPQTWQTALRKWGTISLREALRPAIQVADRGFVVDPTFRGQISRQPRGVLAVQLDQRAVPAGRGAAGGRLDLPQPGSRPDLPPAQQAGHGRVLPRRSGGDIVRTVQHPPVVAAPAGTMGVPDPPGHDGNLRPGRLRHPYAAADPHPLPRLRRVRHADPVQRRIDCRRRPQHRGELGSRRPVADPGAAPIPRSERARLRRPQPLRRRLHPARAARRTAQPEVRRTSGRAKSTRPRRWPSRSPRASPTAATPSAPSRRRASVQTNERGTTNLTVADRWGNVVEYTLTIEQIGGNAMVVPGRGFLLNNELTDFNFTPTQGNAPDPNLPAPGKRPRSSMAPTILLSDGKPFLATGSPGGSSIITTVFQILVNRIDLGMTLPEAIAAPRASQRNAAMGQAEPAFLASPEAVELAALGHSFSEIAEIGAATGVEFLRDGQVVAAAEPVRRGGGSAAVVKPSQ